jgi:hypothetical protein
LASCRAAGEPVECLRWEERWRNENRHGSPKHIGRRRRMRMRMRMRMMMMMVHSGFVYQGMHEKEMSFEKSGK